MWCEEDAINVMLTLYYIILVFNTSEPEIHMSNIYKLILAPQ